MNKKFAIRLFGTTLGILVSMFSLFAVQAQACASMFGETKMPEALKK